jgi:4-hydroxy-tetrahydrodipicolinate synthase
MPLMHLDVSTKLVQNLKLVETMVGVGNEFVRRPRQPLIEADRERVSAVVRKALETGPDVSAYL